MRLAEDGARTRLCTPTASGRQAFRGASSLRGTGITKHRTLFTVRPVDRQTARLILCRWCEERRCRRWYSTDGPVIYDRYGMRTCSTSMRHLVRDATERLIHAAS